ncbi:DNA methylase N-4 [bacterium]|nr:MAG: DNA methylase N-4 [bacterium]
MDAKAYQEFKDAKVRIGGGQSGFPCNPIEVNPLLKPHQRDMVAWGVRGGRRAFFASFGLGKTLVQLETIRISLVKSGGKKGLIVLPLGVRREFAHDAGMLGIGVQFIRSTEEAALSGIYLTNYESVRDGKVDPLAFDAISLDEAAILRGLGGTKTFREFMDIFEGSNALRFVATATPSPNEYIELLAYAAFLGIMDVGEAKTRFFKRNSEAADKLTLHPHKEEEFWLWVASWALFITKPSDLGHSDEGYELPPLDVVWHTVETDHSQAWDKRDKRGQGHLIQDNAAGLSEAAAEKRASMPQRVAKLKEIREASPEDHFVLWHDLEDERRAIEKAVPGVKSVYGSQDLDAREEIMEDFSSGRLTDMAAKPVMLGAGGNYQRHCHRAIYVGIGFKFADFIQSVHRLQRFLQLKRVRVDLIHSEAEEGVKETLLRKWRQHDEMVAKMTAIVRKYGLSEAAMASALTRRMSSDVVVEEGHGWRLVNDDTVEATARMESDSVGQIVTSIPFASQYEYTPDYRDFGHTDDNGHFWAQMDFLTPELLRVLKPGRVACIHVKDRITPGGINGFGFQSVTPFSDECVAHFMKHGFALLARITIVTDVVRENAQTYRLGWTEQCKDGSKMGAGMPEYLLVFRKRQTSTENGYADERVVKSKEQYSRGRWQMDAHGFWKSNGDRLIGPEDFEGLKGNECHRLFRSMSMVLPHDHERDVAIAEAIDRRGILPPDYMLLQPQSNSEDVWTDIARMRGMNTLQCQAKRELHLCPLPFDIVDRAIVRYSIPGDVVYDPFSGLATTPYRAVKLGRVGWGSELNPRYFGDGVGYMRRAEADLAIPSLFNLAEIESTESPMAVMA